MKPRTKTPIESFGPEALAALVKGAREEVRLQTTYRAAVHFRQRLNTLRTRMREENHELYPIVARTRIDIRWGRDADLPDVAENRSKRGVRTPVDPNTEVLLILAPHDAGLAEALKKAGIEAHEADSSDVDNILETYTTTRVVLE